VRQSRRWIGGAVLVLVLGRLWKHNSRKQHLGDELPSTENDRKELGDKGQQSAEQPPKIDFQSTLSRALIFKDILPLIGLLLLPGFALRALVVTQFDLTIAIALVQFTQPVNFALAFLLEALSVYIYSIGLLTLFYSGRWYSSVTGGRLLPVMGAFLLNLACSVPIIFQSAFPEYIAYGLMLFFAPMAAFITGTRWRLLRTETSRDQLRRSVRTKEELVTYGATMEARGSIWTYRFMLLFTTVIVAASGHIWLAPEMLIIRGAPKTGYILQQQDQDLIVYDRGLNVVLRVPKADVSYRQFCDPGPDFTVSEYIFGRPHGRPPCPGLS